MDLFTPFDFTEISYENDEKAFYARRSGKIGYLDARGKELLPMIYDTVIAYAHDEPYVRESIFRNGYVSLRKGKKQLLINIKGEVLFDNEKFGDPYNCQIFYEALGTFMAPVSQRVVKIDGKLEGPYKKKIYLNGKVYDTPGGILNFDGTKVAMGEFSEMATNGLGIGISFNDGLLCVRRNGKYGFIDYTGTEVIPFEYEEAGNFMFGIAIAKKDGEYFAINRKGQKLNMYHAVSGVFNYRK